MNFIDHLKLAYRHKYLIISIILISLIASFIFSLKQDKNQLENTLLLSFAIQNQKTANLANSPYDNLQAADQITESIQGWFLSPFLNNEINQSSQLNFGLKAKKQEKNNLLISFSSDTVENSEKYTQQIISSLQKRLDSYNRNSDLKINLAISENQTAKKASNQLYYLMIGLITGLVISYIFTLFWEFFNSTLKSKKA